MTDIETGLLLSILIVFAGLILIGLILARSSDRLRARVEQLEKEIAKPK